jgi:prevent-host-death family protein
MARKPSDVSAFEAKTHLAELLRETEAGRSFVIRRRGKPVARLIPPAQEIAGRSSKELAVAFRKIRKDIPGLVDVQALIEEGRRF